MSRVRKAAWAVSPGKTAAESWDRIWLGKEEFGGRCLMCGNRGGADWAHDVSLYSDRRIELVSCLSSL